MKTVPLGGKKAAGRVALVDDEDYDLVMQYRWHVYEPAPKPGKRPKSPYAVTTVRRNGRNDVLRMHKLITGWPLTDHADRNGLNNQRSNLRPATRGQNNQNSIGHAKRRSQYKGVCWIPERKLWRANIHYDERQHLLGNFVSELQAAYAYDAAARETFGEYARTNFPEGPTQAMRDQWDADRHERSKAGAANHAASRTSAGWWEQRVPKTYVCVVCGDEYESRAVGASLYCGKKCRKKAYHARKMRKSPTPASQQPEPVPGTLF